jgi:glycosyltransferase involved in cell wall biosynthesis
MQRHPTRSVECDRSNSLELGLILTNEKDHHSKKGSQSCRQQCRRICFLWSRRKYSLGTYVLLSIVFLLVIVLPITRTLGIRLRPRLRKTGAPVTDKSNVPYPPTSVKVSVIIMNHARPNLLQHSALLPVLTEHPNIDEILILHSNPITEFSNEHLEQHLESVQKIQHFNVVELNKKMGLAVRFRYCAVAAMNDWIMQIDDDMELDASAINEMVLAMMENPKRIVGHYGRAYNYWTSPFRHGYDTKDVFGPVEVVLTKVMILEKEICREFEKHAALMEDLIPESHPRWNGEDIFVNLVANHHYGVPFSGPYNNFAIADLNVWDADTDLYPEHLIQQQQPTEEVAISGNMDRNRVWIVGPLHWWKAYLKAQSHTAYRGSLWYLAKQRLWGKKS